MTADHFGIWLCDVGLESARRAADHVDAEPAMIRRAAGSSSAAAVE